jgi:predicted nucleotidyltransferase
VQTAASVYGGKLKSWSLDRYWEEDWHRDRCNWSLMQIASDLTSINCLDPETAASISNSELLIERGVAVMRHYRWVDSTYNFLHYPESKDQVDEYTVFWTIKDFYLTLAEEAEKLLKGGEEVAMEMERRRQPYNPFSEEARRKISLACRRRGARRLILYGSFADGTQGLHSKIDFLAKMNPRLHPHRQNRDMVDLQYDLESILGGRVDIGDASWMRDPYKKDSIENCSVLLYRKEDPGFRRR